MNIAILGGRFDPPHFGHYWVARQVLDYHPEIDELWFMPARKHQWKPIIASGEERMAMLRAFEDKRMKISDIELKREGVSYTIDTIREIKERFNHTIYWIVGADIVKEFSTWEKAEELTTLAKFLVFPRNPYDLPKDLPAGFELVTQELLMTTNLSSTLIRDRLVRGWSIGGFVPGIVGEYIRTKGLYRTV